MLVQNRAIEPGEPRLVLWLLPFLLSGLPAPATAQQSPITLDPVSVAGEGAATTPGGLTTTRQNMGFFGNRSVLETPFSTSGFTEQLIRDQQAQLLSDVLKNDASVTTARTRGTFFDIPNIRGFPIGPTNLLFDGLPGLVAAGTNFELQSIDRIDVIKGPAMLMFGNAQGGVGGAVNYVPKRATAAPVTSLTAGYTSAAIGGAHLDVGRRFGQDQQAGIRMNLATTRGDTDVRDTRIEQDVFALSGDWKPLDNVRLFADFVYARYDNWGYQNALSVAPNVPIPSAPDARNNVTQPWAFYPTSTYLGVVKAEVDIAPEWTASVAYGKSYETRPLKPSPGSPLILNRAGDTRISASYSSYQAQWADSAAASVRGRVATGPLTHELTLGADLLYTAFDSKATTALQPVLSNIYRPIYSPRPALPASSGPTRTTTDSLGWGLVATDMISVLDGRVSVLGGGRYTRLDSSNYSQTNGARLNQFEGGRFNPLGAVLFKPTPASLLYASYTEAFERGGTAPNFVVNANQVGAPLETSQIELGGKIEMGGVLATAALFQIDKGLEYVNSANRFVQDGRQIHRGMELGVSGEPLPGVRLITSAMFLDPFVQKTADPANENHRPPGVPQIQLAAFVDADVPAVTGLAVNAGMYYYSRQYLEINNTRSISPWTRFDVGVRYAARFTDTFQTAFRFNVENLADTNYWASTSNSTLALAAGRTFRLSAQMTW